MIIKKPKNGLTFCRVKPINMRGKAGINKQAFASGQRVRANQRMQRPVRPVHILFDNDRFRILGPGGHLKIMPHRQRRQQLFHAIAQRLIGGGLIGKNRIATHRRDRFGMQ